MRRKMLLVLAVVAALGLFFTPRRLVQDADTIQYVRLTYQQQEQELSQEQLQSLEKLLADVHYRRIWGQDRNSYSSDDEPLEIAFFADGERLYILLGKNNFYYTNGWLSSRQLVGGADLRRQVMSLLD